MFLKHYLQINNLWLINPREGDEDRFKSLNYLCPIEIEERDRSPEYVKPITTEVNAFLEEGRDGRCTLGIHCPSGAEAVAGQIGFKGKRSNFCLVQISTISAESSLRFKVIDILAAGGCALVEWLETGRTHQIFVGGISKLISSKMLLEIAKVFGPVKAYHFEFIADSNQQCAFLEEKIGKPPSYGIPEHANPLLEKTTAVLKLKNVLDPEVLLSLSESELQSVQLCQSTVRTQLSMNLLMLLSVFLLLLTCCHFQWNYPGPQGESKLKADRMHISLVYDKKDKKKKIDCTCFICRGRPITTY